MYGVYCRPKLLKQAIVKFDRNVFHREDGVGWIGVGAADQFTDPDLEDLKQSWKDLQASGRKLDIHSIKEIAKMHGDTGGCWLFFVSTGLKVDHLWSIVAKGVVQGQLGGSAEVSAASPNDPMYGNKHAVFIYHDDFTDEEQVMDMERRIRSLGIKAELLYKPAVYAHLGIYRNNKWRLKSTLYKSNFDLLKGHAVIDSFWKTGY